MNCNPKCKYNVLTKNFTGIFFFFFGFFYAIFLAIHVMFLLLLLLLLLFFFNLEEYSEEKRKAISNKAKRLTQVNLPVVLIPHPCLGIRL